MFDMDIVFIYYYFFQIEQILYRSEFRNRNPTCEIFAFE